MTILAGVIGVLFLISAAWISGLLNKKQVVDIGPALRQLLLDKTEGRISGDEFEVRQAALHDLLLAPAPAAKKDPATLARALPVAVIGACLMIFALVNGLTKDESKSASAMSMLASGVGDKLATKAPLPSAQDIPAEQPKGGDLNTLVKGLADKMESDPNNGEGWLLLARTYGELRQAPNAAKAYDHASSLVKFDAQTYADWADAHVMANNRQWDDQGRSIVARALKADPKNSKALSLAGSEAFDRKQYKTAIDFWKRLKNVEPIDSMGAKLAESNIKEATDLMNGKKPVASGETASPAMGSVSGSISLDDKLKAKAAPTDTVFLVIKAADGSNPPLAAKRFQVSELPVKFQVDDTSSMIPGRLISKFPEVLISARLSKSGDAVSQPGDILTNVVKSKPGVGDIKLEFVSK